ncbi:hypothetical protein LPMP_091180 [Leishmania panamensis]|uniref:Uncharacterized protein n=3 Tax=Leishmania guyanensis species complex TaxID=38579 RepID=A0A088RJF5_LEIPA|nr:hypothetical protein LPMP_091180 [Leishmania panamensis]AIN96033.1 hypothetical protein LPMP_091180 [Leishmania panamensis]
MHSSTASRSKQAKCHPTADGAAAATRPTTAARKTVFKMQKTSPVVAATLSSPKTLQAPKEPIITIISSDGEAFSLSPSSITHSHLLEGAVRRWTEVYQANVQVPTGTFGRATGALCTPTDASSDDATADDLEETPDENYIARFYEETASDVTATSGVLEEVNSSGAAGSSVAALSLDRGIDDDDTTSRHRQERPRVIRKACALSNEEEDAHHPKRGATSVSRRAAGDATNNVRGVDSGDTDSDRTVSLLPSSAEGSMSNTSSPLKLHSNGGTPTRFSDAVGVVTEVAGAAPPNHVLPPGPPMRMPASPKLTASLRRSPAALTAPASRGSRLSPLALLDTNQSTPSVLSGEEGEEGEEEQGSGGSGAGAGGAKPPSRDSRNLGDEGLDDVAVTSSSYRLPSPSVGLATITASAVPNGRGPPHHKDPVVSRTAAFASHAPSSPGGGRSKNRQCSSTVVQVSAAEADDHFDQTAKGDACKTGTAAAAAAMTSTGSVRSGGSRPSKPSTPSEWNSPSSCHQRTPCMTDEDDVGAMMSEDGVGAKSSTPTKHGPSQTDCVGGSSLVNRPQPAPGAGGGTTAPLPPPTERTPLTSATHFTASAGAAAMAALATNTSGADAVAADPLKSSLVYDDGICITSGAIVFDLVRSSSRCESPRSRGAAAAAPVAKSVASATSAPPTATASTVSIRSSTLLVCIKYMKHFAETEAQAAADKAAAGKHCKRRRRKLRRSRHGNGSSGDDDDNDSSATGSSSSSSRVISGSSSNSSDRDDHNTEEASTASDSSFNPMSIESRSDGDAAGKGSLAGNARGATPGTSASTPGGPAVIPAPLTTPLVALLSPWEKNFLYMDVLGAPEAVLAAAAAILDVYPDFDYVSPSMPLGDAKVKAALMTPPPPPEGVQTLMEVMAAAKQLQIDPLHALCAGWLADFVIRVSYGAADNFEAAHLIRQCLRVPSDWSRRETDCLKIENEWPTNEEAE